MRTKTTHRKDAAISAFAERCYAPLRKQERDFAAYSDDLNRINDYAEQVDYDQDAINPLYDLTKAALNRARDTGEEYVPITFPSDEEEEEDDDEEEEEAIVWDDEPDTGHGPWGIGGERLLCAIGAIALIIVVIWATAR